MSGVHCDGPDSEDVMSTTPVTTVETQDGIAVVRVHVSQLDEQNTKLFHAELSSIAAKYPELSVVLDLTEVNLLPSLTLGVLVRITNAFRTRGQRLALAALQQPVREMLTITRMDRVFDLHDDVPSAIRNLSL